MTTDDNIRDKKIQCNFLRKAAKYQHYHQVKLINIEYLTVEEILSSNQGRIKEQAKFTCCPLGKTFEKQIKQLKIKKINN